MNTHIQKCIYCQIKLATTRDHIPPKNLFPKPRPHNLITVPTCESCNLGTSDDDEYFRLMLIMRHDVYEHSAAQVAWQTALRGMRREEKKKLAAKLFGCIRDIEIKSDQGIFLGDAKAFPIDFPSVEGILVKIIRGLFFHVMNKPLPLSYAVKIFIFEAFTSDFWRRPDLTRYIDIGLAQQANIIGDGIFSYRYKFSEDNDFVSLWIMEFFGNYPVIAFIVDNDLHNKLSKTTPQIGVI